MKTLTRQHRKHKAMMTEISNMCAAAGTLVAEEQHQCFNSRTANLMDLVFSVDGREYLVDVTTFDANNPSNCFISGSGISSSYYPGAASVIAAKLKWDRYRFFMQGPQQQLVSIVLEVHGRWGHCARELFKRRALAGTKSDSLGDGL